MLHVHCIYLYFWISWQRYIHKYINYSNKVHLGHITVTWCLVNSFYPIHQCNISVTEIYCFLKTVTEQIWKKIFKILAYIHLLCRFLVASWEEQFACQIITKNPLHLLLSVSHGSEVKLSNTSLICRNRFWNACIPWIILVSWFEILTHGR